MDQSAQKTKNMSRSRWKVGKGELEIQRRENERLLRSSFSGYLHYTRLGRQADSVLTRHWRGAEQGLTKHWQGSGNKISMLR